MFVLRKKEHVCDKGEPAAAFLVTRTIASAEIHKNATEFGRHLESVALPYATHLKIFIKSFASRVRWPEIFTPRELEYLIQNALHSICLCSTSSLGSRAEWENE